MLVRFRWLLTASAAGRRSRHRTPSSFFNLRRPLSVEAAAASAIKRQPQQSQQQQQELITSSKVDVVRSGTNVIKKPDYNSVHVAVSTVCKEITIPVPWGHIAAKEWGHPPLKNDEDIGRRRVLAVHGWQDNCGSFDTLIPLLPADLNIVAFDLPGHGCSSPKPPGAPYRYFDWIADCARVVNHLGWDEFNILAHSMGGAVGIAYAACFAPSVRKLVSLDLIKPWVFDMDDFHERVAGVIRQVLNWEAHLDSPPKSIDYEEAVKMLVERSYNNSISDRSARILLKRGAATVGNGPQVTFTRDGRLKTPLYQEETNEQFKQLAANVRCDLLVTAVDGGLAWELSPREELDEFLQMYRKNARSFKLVKMKGTHHVHMDHPEWIAPHVAEFFAT